MATDSDPISGSSTPNKRRKLNDVKAWNSEQDSGDDLTEEDFHTVATLPMNASQRQLQYTKEQFHSDLGTDNHTYITQPTQSLNINTDSLPNTSDVLVGQSSPIRASPPLKARNEPPAPIRRAFAKPGGLLASAMAPPGTAFRAPLGVQSKPKPVPVDDDSDEDPPVHHSSDEEGGRRGLTSTLKPTNFKTGRESDRSVVKESPRATGAGRSFADQLSDFKYSSSSSIQPGNDIASAYSNSSRRPRPQQPFRPLMQKPNQQPNAVRYESLSDITDYVLREKVKQIQKTLTYESVQRCMDALARCHTNAQDAIAWLTMDEEEDAPADEDDNGADELSSTSPVARRGVAQATEPFRPIARKEVQAPSRTIAEKYTSTQMNKRPSQPSNVDTDDVQPRRRLQQGRKPRSSSPPSSPPKHGALEHSENATITIDDDSDEHVEIEAPVDGFEQRLLQLFNECSPGDLVELSAQSLEVVKLVLAQRPFKSLDNVRAISNAENTKSGKKSKARPIGERIVDLCNDMLIGYEAVDELVAECERIARPIQDALKSWGIHGANDSTGELQMLNLDEAHDSGIGTPSSSCHGEESTTPRPPMLKKRFLTQPTSMSSDFKLKNFQLVGLNWLALLWSQKISCILADDMGLGKTCQVIAFLSHLHEQDVKGVHLIVVPGSTLENWLREFERFSPTLEVLPYYGSQNERAELRYNILEKVEGTPDFIVVTTYDMARNDNKFLRQLKPTICVFDEAHALKNAQSDRYKQLMRVPAKFRILLTGTPLQNNLQELVAILAFIMPDLFAQKQEELSYIFQHKASTKDADHTALLSAERIARARTMMTPFILRRKKNQVLELPAKQSRVEFCDMTPSQSSYYSDVLQDFQKQYATGDAVVKKSKKSSSNVLMALRKAALHPLLARRLYDDKKIDKLVTELLKHDEFAGNERQRTTDYLIGEHHQSFKGGDYGLHRFCVERSYMKRFELKKQPWFDAGKISKFQDLAQDFTANGNRLLIFSQFTSMMDILEAVLNDLGITFLRLDGSTNIQVRQDMLDQFYDDESIKAFMLSTKAGGAGINLACANKVIIFDSGFNPQEDIQAENRAHRVGQTREVEVVRLVTRGTIEEQIYALGESKLALDERVAGEGAAEEKQVEKSGEQMVEKMVLQSLQKQEKPEDKGEDGIKDEPEADIGTDLKDAFKSGLESAGLRVASKQAQF